MSAAAGAEAPKPKVACPSCGSLLALGRDDRGRATVPWHRAEGQACAAIGDPIGEG